MIRTSDFIHLPYTHDLTTGGVAYALHTLPHTYIRKGGSLYDRLRRTGANAAVELAFRRYLAEKNVPFEVKEASPFTTPERFDVALGGRRCELKSFLISRREQILEMKRNPQVVLNAPALVPSDHHAGEGHSDKDIYLFAFSSGLIAASQDDLHKAIHKNLPHHLVHVMPNAWMRPSNWKSLGTLVLKSASAETQIVEVNGQDERREVRSLAVELPPNTRVQVEDIFFSVAYIHSRSLPDARIGIHSPAAQKTHLIGATEWGNIWVYGMEITLAGWITRAEFNQRAKPLREGARVFQYDRTRAKNLSVPVHELKPIQNLLERVREWQE